MRSYGFMLCGRFYISSPSLLVTVARGVAAARNGGFFHGRGFVPRRNGGLMQFFASAVTTLQTLVVALGAGLAVWGVVNLLEGYGSDNPGANAHVR